MDEFEKIVNKCQKYNINKDIENSAWKHALTLFKYLLKEAAEKQQNVSIVTGRLNNGFYNELYDSASEYLQQLKENGKKIDIVILSDIDKESELKSNKFAQFAISLKGKIGIVKDINKPHFILVGNNSYRFETDHAHTKAVANFNDNKTGNLLGIMFKDLIAKAA